MTDHKGCPSCDHDLSYPGKPGHTCYTYEEWRANQARSPEDQVAAAEKRIATLMAGPPTLWHVEITEEDWDYDQFESAVVWATSAEEAERVIRQAWWYETNQERMYPEGKKMIENPDWHLVVTPAPTQGVALMHWHAG